MARKKKRERRQNTKSKVEFVKSVCKICGLCDITKGDVSGKNGSDLFCYDFLYAATPHAFLKNVFPQTKKLGFWAHDVEEETPTTDEIDEFQFLFCNSGLCNTDNWEDGLCPNIEFCIGLFRDFVVADCGVVEDSEMTTQNDSEFFQNNWDGNSEWNRFNQVTAKTMGKKGKCKKRGKNKAKKKRDKKKHKVQSVQVSCKRTEVKKLPSVTCFTNMSEEQIRHIYGDDENNDSKQSAAAGDTG